MADDAGWFEHGQPCRILRVFKAIPNNKFNRDSFSFEDIVVASYACDYTLALLANDGSQKRKVDAESFFDKDVETWNRISGLKYKSTDSKRAEYEQKKAELERMKKEYGFDD